MTPDMIELLKQQEGYRRMPYKDTEGVLTIGYGTNIADGLEPYEAEALMLAHIAHLEKTLPSKIQGWYTLSTARKDVLINMAYNLGDKLFEFNNLLAAIANGNYKTAAEEMLNSRWARQVGNRAKVLADIMRGCSV